jgi:hypothetical protein
MIWNLGGLLSLTQKTMLSYRCYAQCRNHTLPNHMVAVFGLGVGTCCIGVVLGTSSSNLVYAK